MTKPQVDLEVTKRATIKDFQGREFVLEWQDFVQAMTLSRSSSVSLDVGTLPLLKRDMPLIIQLFSLVDDPDSE